MDPATLESFEALEDGSEEPNVVLTLGDGIERAAGATDATPRAQTKPLSKAQTQSLLSRIEKLETEPDDQLDFAKRKDSPKAPKTGATVRGEFPPEEERNRPANLVEDADAPLKVLRFSPEGEVPLAPKVSVTFNHPMVAVTSHADSVAGELPVKMDPQPEGSWRWVGSRTLLFEPAGERLPMATNYTVTVASGTKSAGGKALAEDVRFEFSTPPLTLKRHWPAHGTHDADRIAFLEFDQKIDRAKLAEHIDILASGESIPSRLATESEIEEQPEVAGLVKNAQPGRWIAVRAAGSLPLASGIQVTVPNGAPSAEGPRVTDRQHTMTFTTYGPLEVTRNDCGYRSECKPNSPFTFRFSNRLDGDAFDPSWILITPKATMQSTNVSYDRLAVTSLKSGRQTYVVTLSPKIKDEFGQTLGEEKTYKFEVGGADPTLYSTSSNFITLDPASKTRSFTIYTTNYDTVDVVARKVQPKDYTAYLKWLHDHRYYGKKEISPPGKVAFRTSLSIDGTRDELTTTAIDLAEALGSDGLGNLVLEVKAGKVTAGSTAPRYKPEVRTWIQSTRLGLDALTDSAEMVAWASDLLTGEPIENATFELARSQSKATSNARGIARFDLPDMASGQGEMLVVRKGSDTAFLPRNPNSYRTSPWQKSSSGAAVNWFVFDDRGMYKPGEEVHVKGWIREVDLGKFGDVSLKTGLQDVTWKAYGPRNNELANGTADLTSLGGFDFNFSLPDTPNLGYARIALSAGGHGTSHQFQIQEFRTPEFEVSAGSGEGPFFANDSLRATVEANYYAGGALPNADVNWSVNWSTASYTPPERGDYTFGVWSPWWRRSHSTQSSRHETFSSKTDAAGVHHLDISTNAYKPPRPISVKAQASVTDVNRQQWSSSTSMLVHPSSNYVGLKTDSYFVEQGKPLEVDVIVSDIDGTILEGHPVKVRASRVKYSWNNGTYEEQYVGTQECEFQSKTDAPHQCTFETREGGQYKISATTSDSSGRLNYTELTRWVSGGARPASRKVEMEEAQLIPDRETYQPGDVAKILVQSPFVPAEGLMTVRRQGIETEKRFSMKDATTVVEIPIKNTHYPNVFVAVDLIGSSPRLDSSGKPDDSLPRRPAIASGTLKLDVPPLARELDVVLKPASDRVSPGEKTSVDVTVRRNDGSPVKDAEVAVVVVDEAILALSSYSMGDPINVFYPTRSEGVTSLHLRPFVELVDPDSLNLEASGPPPESDAPGRGGVLKKESRRSRGAAPAPSAPRMMMMDDEMAAEGASSSLGGLDDASSPIAVRTDFNPLATFSPVVSTDASGQARVAIDMPDNLTRYRVMAVAVSGGKFVGSAESNITARLPLMVRPSPPRFLNFGDEFEFPIVVQNQTDEAMPVDIALRTANLDLDDPAGVGYSFSVPANDRVEVRFDARALKAGTARYQMAVSAGSFADAADGELPVWTPATSEAFATYGTIDSGGIAQPVKMPEEVWPQFGQLEISTSSTALQSLTDAFIYLYDYDYQCAEQISSRIISIAALRDVLSAFEAEGLPDEAALKRSMSRDIEELQSRQNNDGGFGVWRKGQPSWPYVTLHVAHALIRAEAKGYTVPTSVVQRFMSYLKNIENHIPAGYSEWTRRHIIAYSLYVRGLKGDYAPAQARALIGRAGGLENLTFEAVGWLLGVFANASDSSYSDDRAKVRRFLGNRVTETAGNAHFAASMNDGHHLIMHSNRRADGVVLEALIDDQPKSDLIPKIVSGLMAHRKRGHWGNTQENAFVLLALDKYFRTYEKETPDFVARAWLGDQYAGEHAFRGRTTETHQIDIPMRYIDEAASAGETLYLQKDGKGRMYYRIGMTYAPKSLKLDPSDHGFAIERLYEAVDDPDDVKRRGDGVWEVKAGAKVKITLTMAVQTRRYHVALVDPLPAGFESMNPALAVTGDVPVESSNTGRSGYGRWWWFSRPWYEHQNMRDERTEAFASMLWGGVHTYTYYARATTPGTFIAPPTKAEEMYHPETFGRSASEKVVVVDR